MMKYKGCYWFVLSQLIESSISKRYSRELGEKAVVSGKKIYRDLLSRADNPGDGNPLAARAYVAYAFAACWLATGKLISPAGMGKIMGDVLKSLKPLLALTNLNRSRYWERRIQKYQTWAAAQGENFPGAWKVELPENLHSCGTSFRITHSPVCTFFRQEGLQGLLAPLEKAEEALIGMQHGKLIRGQSMAGGDPVSDYWIVGDKVQNPQ